MRVAEYIAELIADDGIEHVFMVTGGGAMHLNDALGREPRLTTVFNHHEQACAMAAESYARLCGRPAAVNVTTGPGGINALNGVISLLLFESMTLGSSQCHLRSRAVMQVPSHRASTGCLSDHVDVALAIITSKAQVLCLDHL